MTTKRRLCEKLIPYAPLSAGSLDGRTPMGISYPYTFRYLLNIDCIEAGRLSRMPGWTGWMACESTRPDFSRGNLDLHDQLAGVFYKSPATTVSGTITDVYPLGSSIGTGLGITTVPVVDSSGFIPGSRVTFEGVTGVICTVETVEDGALVIRADSVGSVKGTTKVTGPAASEIHFENEPINHLVQLTSACDQREFIACTTSRIYLSTGTCANWRVLAFDLAGNSQGNPTDYGETRWMSAQLGNFIFFTNNYDFILGWRVGDEPDPEGGWSVKYIQSLIELDIRRAGCIASWNGFMFLGDITTSLGPECSRIYWSDFNNPLEWAPGGESMAGYVDLGKTEKILRMESLGKQMVVYTTNAIYNMSLVGGDEVFRCIEVYRGPDALAFRHALANLGDSHLYLTNRSIVEFQLYSAIPQRVDPWERAAGVIFNGIKPHVVQQIPGGPYNFGPMDKKRCNEIIFGYDRFRRQVWACWPTTTADDTAPDGVKRMSMVISTAFGQSTLVDHAFSAFASFIPTLNDPTRNWMVEIGACSQADVAQYVLPYEGKPENPVCPNPNGYPCPGPQPPPCPCMPQYLINEDEDWTQPADPNSVCAIYGSDNILVRCNPCYSPVAFAMASLEDRCIKQLEPKVRLREVYDHEKSIYLTLGYNSIMATELGFLGRGSDVTVKRMDFDFTHTAQPFPLNIHAQVVVGPMAECPAVWDTVTYPLACDYEHNDMTAKRGIIVNFPFYCTNRFVGWRLFLSSGPKDTYDFTPVGGEVDFTRVDLKINVQTGC